MLPPAPGLFSTTTDCPRDSPSFCATRRPTMSVVLPGPKATMNCTGRCLGHSCARAGNATAASAARTKTLLLPRVTCIPGPPRVAADSRRESKEDIAFAGEKQHALGELSG